MPKYWKTEDIEIVKKYYNQISAKQIKEKFLPNKSIECIRHIARKHGIKGSCGIKIYSCNEQFFSIPNIINSYFAGYLAADGYITKDFTVGVECKIDDRALLDNFKHATQSTYPIYIRDRGEIKGFKDSRIYIRQPNAVFKITWIKQWVNDLQTNWNIYPKKSLNIQPPNLVNSEYIAAYIIGYFDGDGHVGITKDKYLEIGFSSGSKDILEWIFNHTKTFVPHLKWKDSVRKGHHGFCIGWTKNKAVQIHKFYREYIEIPYRLKRKWDIIYP